MLFGHNGRLIKSQGETDLALEKLLAHLDTVSVPTRSELIEHFTRIDLAWHFQLKFEEIEPFYRNAYIHGIRSKPSIYKTGIHVKGTDLEF
ncbi:MAG: hypothetical protein B9S32_08870 [Verrucomicrobia bacterium Tous-C9LFEB]|nr:MAG: hypothetical protein B9S32_08870 [Verrucomicrobia bacterium Tous-C9LFEB]